MAKSTEVRLSEYCEIIGPKGFVAYAKRRNGKLEARGYLESLTKAENAFFKRKFEQLSKGEKLPPNQFSRYRESKYIYEFKHHSGKRVYCFKDVGGWWLTSGHDKAPKNKQRQQVNRAEAIMREHLETWNIVKDI